MSTLPDGITMADLRKLAKLDASIKKAELMKEILVARVKTALPDAGTYVFEEVIVEIQIPDVLNEKKFLKERPQLEYPDLYTVKPDTKAIQKASGKLFYILGGGSPRLSVKTTK